MHPALLINAIWLKPQDFASSFFTTYVYGASILSLSHYILWLDKTYAYICMSLNYYILYEDKPKYKMWPDLSIGSLFTCKITMKTFTILFDDFTSELTVHIYATPYSLLVCIDCGLFLIRSVLYICTSPW